MSEFVDKDFKIYTMDKEMAKQYVIEELLPYGFKL